MSKPNKKGGGSGELPIETDFRLKQERSFEPKKNQPIERTEIAFIEPPGPDEVEIPQQKAFFKIPARFGHVPVAEEPLGYDHERRFEQHYPRIELPFQLVDRVETGIKRRYEKDDLFLNGLNRLFFGDCLHVMRMLPSECIDLIYIDPPFFSGRNYNIIFGDKNEVRSFTDIWEGGMPGYLIWLNARLYEMKRLLKPTGVLYVHLDSHASHYVKCELDRIFGHDHFLCEIVWKRISSGRKAKSYKWLSVNDTLLLYEKQEHRISTQYAPYSEKYLARYTEQDENGWYYWDNIGTYSQERLNQLKAEGRVRFPDNSNAKPRIKNYLHEGKGVIVDNV